MRHFSAPPAQRGALCVSCPIQEKTLLTCYIASRAKTELFMMIGTGQGAMRGIYWTTPLHLKERNQGETNYIHITHKNSKREQTAQYLSYLYFSS